MNTRIGWDNWDNWDNWSSANPSKRGHNGNSLAASQSLRATLVNGPFIATAPVAAWQISGLGDPLLQVSPTVRGQIICAELLAQVKLDLKYKDKVKLGKKTISIKGQFDLEKVEALASLRSARSSEIFDQVKFSPRPWAQVLALRPDKTPYTLELMTLVTGLSSYLVMRIKAHFNQPRPSFRSPRIQPIISVPTHSTFPSGHAMESMIVSLVLIDLLKTKASKKLTDSAKNHQDWVEQVQAMILKIADRIAQNREVAGLHFSVDTQGGQDCAHALFSALKTVKSPGYDWLLAKARQEWGQ
jgi:hypothetical protein